MKKITRTLAVILSLILILSACAPAGSETTENVTDAPTTEEITTEENVETTEQTMEFKYEVEYSLGRITFKNPDDYFFLFTSREDIDKISGLETRLDEKYDEKWFESHAFVLFSSWHGSCCFIDLNQVQFDDGCLTMSFNVVPQKYEDFYKERGKDYEYGTGGNFHHEDEGGTIFIIEFEKELLGSLQKVIQKTRDYPSASWYEVDVPLRESEPPVLELEDVPFIAGYRWTEKEKYRYANEYLYGYEKWGDKMVVSATMYQLQICFDATDSEELREKRGFLSRTWNSAAIYTMLSLKASYDCEVKKVSFEDETLRVYADVVHKQWEQLTEAERAEIKSGKVGFLDETDENKYEMYLAINTEYREEYVELMKTLKKGVLVLRDVMSGKTTEMELEFFSLIDKEYLPY